MIFASWHFNLQLPGGGGGVLIRYTGVCRSIVTLKNGYQHMHHLWTGVEQRVNCFCTRKTLHTDSKGIIDILDPQIAAEKCISKFIIEIENQCAEIGKSVDAFALSNTAALTLTVTRKFL